MSEHNIEKLSELLKKKPEIRPQVVMDCVEILEQEVNKQRGPVGLLIKGSFKLIKGLGGNTINKLVDWLLDEFLEALDPFYEDYSKNGYSEKTTFSSYLQQRDEEAAEALLNVTDRRRRKAKNKVLIKAYDRLRPYALKAVTNAIPSVGKLVEKYLPPPNISA